MNVHEAVIYLSSKILENAITYCVWKKIFFTLSQCYCHPKISALLLTKRAVCCLWSLLQLEINSMQPFLMEMPNNGEQLGTHLMITQQQRYCMQQLSLGDQTCSLDQICRFHTVSRIHIKVPPEINKSKQQYV